MSLISALDRHNLEETTRILDANPDDVGTKDEEDRVALHYAAENCELPLFQTIYEKNPSLVDAGDKNGHTPLLNAVMMGRKEIAEFLVSKGANVQQVDHEGHNAVHWATVCAQTSTLSWAIEKGVEVNLKDKTQNACPVHYATVNEEVPMEQSVAVLVTLLKHGADANAKDKDDRTPILWCASNGNIEAIKILKAAGSHLTAKDRDMLTILHCAASHGYHEVIEYSLESLPRDFVDDADRGGHTALFYAVSFGHYESALVLLKNGADPNHQDNRLRTAAHCAASKGQMRMLKLLKQHGASFVTQNYRGDLPFHEAVQTGSRDIVEWLFAMEPSVLNAANHQGRTGIHLAAASGDLEMVVLLCTKGCFVDPLMFYKGTIFTPLDFAKKQKHELVVEYLTKNHSAQSVDDMSQEKLDEWRTTFEEQVVRAKLDRGKRLEELEEKKTRSKMRRPSSSSQASIVDMGTNTTARPLKSAESSRVTVALTKATSTTSLGGEPEKMIPANFKALNTDITEENDSDGIDLDEDDFENLPEISDSSETTDSESEQEDNSDSHVRVKRGENQNGTKTSSKKHLDEGEQAPKKKSSKIVMSVRREPEIGDDGGDIDIVEDEWQHAFSRVNGLTDANDKKFIHEKAIFQELTHLKRMQIQYGKVQEKVLVRSLVSNFCKMHGLELKNFKFNTFYAWEKFLYNALSEQLKMIYMEERERLSQARTSYFPLDKFGSRALQSAPLTEKMNEMRRIYTKGTMSRSSAKGKTKKVIEGSKRCDCLEKHIILQQNA